jgi:hypothetical protein
MLWGPNLVRNFANTDGARVISVSDLDPPKLALIRRSAGNSGVPIDCLTLLETIAAADQVIRSRRTYQYVGINAAEVVARAALTNSTTMFARAKSSASTVWVSSVGTSPRETIPQRVPGVGTIEGVNPALRNEYLSAVSVRSASAGAAAVEYQNPSSISQYWNLRVLGMFLRHTHPAKGGLPGPLFVNQLGMPFTWISGVNWSLPATFGVRHPSSRRSTSSGCSAPLQLGTP